MKTNASTHHRYTLHTLAAVTVLSLATPATAQTLFVSDLDDGTILEITPGGTVATFASGLTETEGLAFDGSGNLYAANYGSGTISKITPGRTVTTFASGLNEPTGLAFDGSGNLYAANYGSSTISKITPGGTVTTFASGFSGPAGLAFDGSGNLYAANHGGSTISKITPDGTVTTFASGLSSPAGLAFDGSGNLYAANFGNGTAGSGTISKITPGGTVTTFASGLNEPTGLAFDSSGNLYAANNGSDTISKITPGGTVTIFASGLPNIQFIAIQPSISGTVTNTASNPIQGAMVSVVVSGTTYSATSAANGTYMITGVPVGTGYTVSTSAGRAYLNGTVTGVTITAGNTTTGVNFALNANPFQWAIRVASTVDQDNELSIGMTLDSQGNCYVTGWFDGTNDFGGVTLTNDSGGGQDIFVAKYNSTGSLQWAQRAGGTTANRDAGRGIGVDNAGNVYVTGGFYGVADFGSFSLTGYQNQTTFFLAKYNSVGTVQWVQQSVGGQSSGGVYGTGLAVDSAGNCYAVGFANASSTSATNITFGTKSLSIPIGDYSAFLVKYDNTGTVQWAQLIGGSGKTYATKVAVDAAGNVYVSGQFTANLTIGNSNLVDSDPGSDMFIAKFDNSGALTWVSQLGEAGGDGGGVAVDQAGDVYVSGVFSGTSDFDGISLTSVGSTSGFVAKYSSSGAIQWARQAGNITQAEAYTEVALDGQGNIYPAGVAGPGSVGPNGSGGEAIVANYDPSGTLLWTYSASGPSASPWSSFVKKCAVDSAGNCYLAGWYQTTTTFGTTVLQPQGYWNFFLTKLTPAPVITSQTQSQTVNAGQNASFTVAATGSAPLSYQWQVSTNGGSTWANLSNNASYSGSGTATLTVSGTTTVMSGNQFQCLVSNGVSPNAISSAATLTVLTPFQQWQMSNFGSTTVTRAQPTATPANDGISNLLKYAFNFPNPLVPNRSGLPVVGTTTSGSSQYLTITYTTQPLASDLTYSVQGSADMATWTAITPPAAATTSPVTVQDTTPLSTGIRRFLRVVVVGPGVITQLGAITGTVTNSASSPIQGATVSVVVSGTTYSATSVADGTYTITGVPVGTGYTVTAIASGNYGDGTVSDVSVTAGNTTSEGNFTLMYSFAAWAANNGVTGGELGNLAHDGVSNLLKYAFNLNPLVSNRSGLPVVATITSSGSQYLTITYTTQPLAGDLTYSVQASTDEVNWMAITTPAAATTSPVTVQDTTPLSSGIRRFLRVVVVGP